MAKKHSPQTVSKLRCDKNKPAEPLNSTTVYLQNIALNMSRKQLMQALDQLGFRGTYNMIYVPFNQTSGNNLGYAFINFTQMVHAERLREEFEGYQLKKTSPKICLVDRAKVQGFDNF
jgi:RNA recognition motif-containing protein